jgi:hypothetical protein
MFSKLCSLLTILLFAWIPASAQKFLPDDPMLIDRDDLIDPGEPRVMKLSDYYDFLNNTFNPPGDRSRKHAANANTLGEVPDSSWFQNRHGHTRMTTEELVRGPNKGNGPSTTERWIVTEGKTEGITPGFRIRDSRGDHYVIKFDPVTNPEMATAAEVISTKFFYAMGYNVPENYLVFFRRDDLRVDRDAEISVGLGPRRRMTETDLDQLLGRTSMTSDKRYRAVASKIIEGRPIGPFRYFGTRSDDPNDVIPHEHRRELRGLKVFSAWLNHDDSRAVNTQDSIVNDGRHRYIRHYLIDFGSTLGSGSVTAQKPRAGAEYLWEPWPVLRRIMTVGIWDSAWIRVRYPESPSIGRFESKTFEPQNWKPEYPNAAFDNALPDDCYWAAKIVMAFTDDDVRAVVRTGSLTDPEAEQYLIQTLIERRNKIGRYYFDQVLALDGFALDENIVRFAHLPTQHGFAGQPENYTVSWFRFDNAKNEKISVANEYSVAGRTFAVPPELLSDGTPYFGVEIRNSARRELKGEAPSVSLFMHRFSPGRIIGVERTWHAQ